MTQFEHSAVETLDRLTGIFKYLLFAEHLTGQYKESCRTFGDTAVPGPLSVWSEYCSAVAQYRGTGAAATLFALVGRAAVPGQERQYTVRGTGDSTHSLRTVHLAATTSHSVRFCEDFKSLPARSD